MSEDKQPFGSYAMSYDALYEGKNYESECDFVERCFKRFAKHSVNTVLDLGCGTGGHAIPLTKRGFTVFGVDLSQSMLDIAKQKSVGLNALRLQQGNVQNVRIGETFDAVLCLFAVLSYQIDNASLQATFETVRKHLRPGGIFITDFWYGPGVLSDPPTDRLREVKRDGERILRFAHPEVDTLNHIVDVSYELLTLGRADREIGHSPASVRNPDLPVEVLLAQSRETHQMRYLFKPELELIGGQYDLSLVHFCAENDIDGTVSAKSWNASAVFLG